MQSSLPEEAGWWAKRSTVESYILMLTMFSDSKCSLLAKNLWMSPIVTCVDNLMNFFCNGYKEKQAHSLLMYISDVHVYI